MMKTRYNLLAGGIFLFGMAMTSCSSEEFAPATETQLSQIPVKVVISVTDGNATRTSLEEVEGNLKWEWEQDDVVVATNANGKYKGTLTVSEVNKENKKSATFEGNLFLNVNDGATQKLNFHYLGKGFTDFAGVDGTFNINVAQQSGNIEDLVKNDILSSTKTYDVAVNANYIAIPEIELGHLTSVGHFAINLPDNEEVASVVVTGDNLVNSADLNLGQITLENKADAEDSKGITVADNSDFYITLIPNDDMTFHFDVVSKAGNTYAADLCYTGTEDAVRFNLQGSMFLRQNLGYAPLAPQMTGSFTYVLNFNKAGEEDGNVPESMTKAGPGNGSVTFTLPDKGTLDYGRNHSFTGWDNNGTVYMAGSDYTVYQNSPVVDFTAHWTLRNISYAVRYDGNGAQSNVPEATSGTVDMTKEATHINVTVSSTTPVRDGYHFDGWKANGEGELLKAGDSYDLVEDIQTETAEVTFVAQWSMIETYTLIFNANVGNGITVSDMPQTMTVESWTGKATFTLPTAAPTADKGLTFKGWSTSIDGDVISTTTHKVTEKNSTLYAIWEQDKPNTSGGSGDMGGFDPTANNQN